MTSGSLETSCSMMRSHSETTSSDEVDTSGTNLASGRASGLLTACSILFASPLCSNCIASRRLHLAIRMSLTHLADTLTANSKSWPSRTFLRLRRNCSSSSRSPSRGSGPSCSPSSSSTVPDSRVWAQPLPLIWNSVVELMHAKVLRTSLRDVIRLSSIGSRASRADSVAIAQISLRFTRRNLPTVFSNSLSSSILTSWYMSSEHEDVSNRVEILATIIS
mmetsp:Transcript_430/g.1691  ORF Transcript_430/g.1691 Transcript_430/m.1691 type:complete len:220 (+) Transcript_430:792-1451(+)